MVDPNVWSDTRRDVERVDSSNSNHTSLPRFHDYPTHGLCLEVLFLVHVKRNRQL